MTSPLRCKIMISKDYQCLFDHITDMVIEVNEDGVITYANRAAIELCGHTARTFAGLHVAELIPEERYLELYEKIVNGKKIRCPFEQELRSKDGTIKTIALSVTPLRCDKRICGLLLAGYDITNRLRCEKNIRSHVREIIKAQEDERKRIAREIHDDVSPNLLLLIQRIDALCCSNKVKTSDWMKMQMEHLRCQTVEGLESLRRIAQDLRPRILDDLGLIAALEWLADNMIINHGVEAQVEISGERCDLPSEVQLLIFRIVQEALNNIRKHSKATIAIINIDFSPSSIDLVISDNGKGFVIPDRIGEMPASGKLGLAGMQERAQLLGGSVDIESEPEQGSKVTIHVPLMSAPLKSAK